MKSAAVAVEVLIAMNKSASRIVRGGAWASLFCALVSLASCAASMKATELVVRDNDRQLRDRAKDAPQSSPGRPAILFLAFDGVDRSLLYDMLRKGELPHLAALLGDPLRPPKDGEAALAHAYLDDTMLSTMPSSTMAAWATTMTGVTPAYHGVTGNEFFIREERRLGAPAPVSFADSKPTISIYTDGYMNSLVKAKTVYERMRIDDPNVLIWVGVHHIFTGADRMFFAKKTILIEALEEGVMEVGEKAAQQKKPSRRAYVRLDRDVVEVVTSALDSGPVPDVLTLYLSGTDLYAHIAEEGPNEARRAYLHDIVDPAMSLLYDKLTARNALADRYVVLTSDHGHTPVLFDDKHALSTVGDNHPPALMTKAGYRIRPFKMDVSPKDDFDAVLCEGGATAYIYLADRSKCPKPGDVCDWQAPPRFEEDVVPMAEAFHTNNEDGALVPGLRGSIDLILTRRPKVFSADDVPFGVYMGHGKTMPIGEYLREHPRPTYVELEARLRDLAVGPHGERAGDIMLIAHNGDRDAPADRYYFASLYRSWHGSPSRQDSEIPFIVAHPSRSTAELHARVSRIIGANPRQQKVADVLLDLRTGK